MLYIDERLRSMDRLNNEDMAEDGHKNFSVSRRLNRIEVEAVANGKDKKKTGIITNED
jgi:hypothetical protein